MIDFEKSLENKINWLQNFISPSYKTVLDLGCGSGVDSIALSKLGLNVHAIDHSPGMIKIATENFDKYMVNINLEETKLENLSLVKNYDLIISLGNTIANIDYLKLENLLTNLVSSLQERGKIVVQIINFAKLPTSGNHLLNEFENESLSIIRTYTILPDSIDFIIKRIDKKNNSFSRIKTSIFPHSEIDFRELAKKNHLNVDFYGNLKKEPYLENESDNLVVQFSK